MSLDRAHGTAATANKKGSEDHGPKPGKQTEVDKKHDRDGDDSVAGVDVSTMQAFLTKHEGKRDTVYLDSRGFRTGGIGHLLEGTSWRVGQSISEAQITAWFKQDLKQAIAGAQRKLGSGTYDKLTEARRIVVIDMVFNLGEKGFGQFEQTIAAIRAGQYSAAATRMLQSLWAQQVGRRATENASIMRSGHFAAAAAARSPATTRTTITTRTTRSATSRSTTTTRSRSSAWARACCASATTARPW